MNAAISGANETMSHGIVVGYDGSPGSRLALDWAIETAKRDERPLTLLHCVGLNMTPTFRAYDPGVQAHTYDEMARGVLAEAIEIASRRWTETRSARSASSGAQPQCSSTPRPRPISS